MAQFKKIRAPEVTIEQIQVTQSIDITTPTLAPFIFGVCREIVNALDDTTGSWNSISKYRAYGQLPQTVPYLQFPSPRGNIDQVTIEDKYTRVFHDFGATINELSKTSNFLLSYNRATQPIIRTDIIPADGWDLNPVAGAKTLVLVQNQTVPVLTNLDVAVRFTSVGNAKLSNDDTIKQINTAYGKTVCRAVTLTGEARPRIEFFGSFGAAGSITIRGGASANSVFGFNAQTERIEGAGFRGQDTQNGTSRTTWIEWFRGSYYLNGAVANLPAGDKYGFKTSDGLYVNSISGNVTYAAGGIEILVGDEFWGDGVQVGGAIITKIEASRFRLGKLNTVLSTFDSAGKVITAVYDPVQLGLMNDSKPFAPIYVWFKANELKSTGTPTAAILTGNTTGVAATVGLIEGGTIAGPFSLTGLYLDFEVTVDGVATTSRFTFSASAADVPAVVTAIGSGVAGLIFANNSGRLRITTIKAGADQSVKLLSTGSANAILGFSTNADTFDAGTDVLYNATPAKLVTSGNTFPITLANNDKLVVKISTDGGVTYGTTKTHTSSGATYNTIDDLVTALAADNNLVGGGLITIGKSGVELTVTSVATGESNWLKIDATSNGVSPTKIAYTINQVAYGTTGITGMPLRFKLNYRTRIYEVTPQTNSLTDLIKQINEAVGVVVASGNTSLVLTSTIKGYSSTVEVLNDVAGLTAARTLGFLYPNTIAFGSGRPLPELVINSVGKYITIDGELLRNTLTGDPFDPAVSNLYIQYRGIRRDVSPAAKTIDGQVSPIRIGNETELNAVLSPVSRENPLALALWLAFKDAPNSYIYCFGVDEISDEYPDGTPGAYQRILDAVEGQEIYTLAPLTDNMEILQNIVKNTANMNLPESGTERIAFINTKNPTRGVSTLVAEGVGGSTILGATNSFVLDINPNTALVQAGINTALPIPVSANVYLEIKVGTKIRNYNVSNVNSTILTLKTSFTATENVDGFFTTTPLTESLSDQEWNLFIRGNLLVITGSTIPDKQAIAENIYLKIQNYFNPTINSESFGRYIYHIVADTITMTLPDGTIEQVPGYFASANYAGLNGVLAPQQPLTNYKITGYQNVSGTSGYFTKEQLDLIAGGGGFTLVNTGNGRPLFSRQQLATDTSTIETRELSIRKSLDFLKKLVRMRYLPFLGNRNITDQTLADIGMQNGAIKSYLEDTLKAFKSITFSKLIQDKQNPDQIFVDIMVQVLYPLNKIRVRIYF